MLFDFVLRSAISGAIATTLYFVAAGLVSRFYARRVARSVLRHDIKWGLVSLAFGSPVLQGFAVVAEKHGVGNAYADIGAMGWVTGSSACRSTSSAGTSSST